jgi:hypothetical protein
VRRSVDARAPASRAPQRPITALGFAPHPRSMDSGSQSHHRQWIPGMCSQACELQIDEPPVKSRTWPHRRDFTEKTSRQPECHQSSCDIHPVRSAKRLDQPTRRAPIPGDLVVLEDHFRNLRCPLDPARSNEVGARQPHGRRQVIKCAVGPDSQVMERRRDCYLLELLRATRRLSHAQVHDSVGVVSVSGEVAAKHTDMRVQDLIENRYFGEQHGVIRLACLRSYATFVCLAVNRLTNSSAFSATSRQPASIVSAWPRPGILTISVTPLLRFCFL